VTSARDPAAIGDLGVGATPKQRRGIEVRDRLFEAALAEFEEHGVEESRVERIVAAAGTSWGTFFRYFPRKEDVLILAAARHVQRHVQPALERGLADETRSVRAVVREALEKLGEPERSPQLHAEILWESQRYPARFAALLGDGRLPFVRMLAAAMEEGQRRGEVRSDAPALITATVLGAAVVFSTAQVLRAVAAGQLPVSRIVDVAGMAFDVAWTGVQA